MSEETNVLNLEMRLVDRDNGAIHGSVCRSIHISTGPQAGRGSGGSLSKLTDSLIQELRETAASQNLEICEEEDVRSAIAVALLLALAENRIDACLDVHVREIEADTSAESEGEADAGE